MMRGIAMTERSVVKVQSGDKWQTRRIINVEWSGRGRNRAFRIGKRGRWICSNQQMFPVKALLESPHKVGDVLYVKEAIKKRRDGLVDFAYYKSDETPVYGSDKEAFPQVWRWKNKVLPARYMPKSAARTFKRITEVRCERIQEISWQDVIAEGCDISGFQRGAMSGPSKTEYARTAFQNLWDETNGKGSWESNPWVYVYSFELTERPDDV